MGKDFVKNLIRSSKPVRKQQIKNKSMFTGNPFESLGNEAP